jgi:4-hydroxy-tetrahydrodipicolinate synthase
MGLRPGVHNVMATPFLPDESLDLESVCTLIDYLASAGVDGVLVLGVLGEADKLSDDERDAMIAETLKRASGRLQVTVGITHGSTAVVRERARRAAEAGADAVMISPPPGSSPGAALHDLFQRAADDLDIPIVIQDHPASSGVKMSAEFIARLEPDLPPESVVKLEDPPTGPKIVRLRQAAGMYRIFGGLGGVNLIAELEAGSDGTMTGFAFADILVRIVKAYLAKDRAKARELFNAALPLIVFEAQPGAGVGLRKEILRRRGAIRHATVRQPAPEPSPVLLAELDRVLAAFE